LKENIRINNLAKKVTALNIGIGAKQGILSFTQNFDTVNHVIIDKLDKENGRETSLVQVPVETLDHLLVDKKAPLLLKIDVEGFEQEVINGAAGVLGDKNLKAIIIELNGCGLRYGFEDINIHEQLKSYGFVSYLYNPFKRELQIAEGFGKFNTIYLRDMDLVQKRLKTAESFIALSEKI
jgi:FkbM family methyltransferase